MHGTYAGCKEWNGWAMHPLVMYLSINTSNDLQKKKKKERMGCTGSSNRDYQVITGGYRAIMEDGLTGKTGVDKRPTVSLLSFSPHAMSCI